MCQSMSVCLGDKERERERERERKRVLLIIDRENERERDWILNGSLIYSNRGIDSIGWTIYVAFRNSEATKSE